MKQNWIPTLLFSLAFGVLGFILGTMIHHGPHSGKPCCAEMVGCQTTSCCEKGSKSGLMEASSMEEDQKMMDDVMAEFENSNFIGDTTIFIPGGTIEISKTNNGEMSVSVNMEKEMESEYTGKDGNQEIRKEKRILKMESDGR